MANVAKVSVAAASGEYASASEVMREALREWKKRRALRPCAIEELGRLWDAGLAISPPTDGEAALGRVRDKLGAKLADRPDE